jgi:hypothetical protein
MTEHHPSRFTLQAMWRWAANVWQARKPRSVVGWIVFALLTVLLGSCVYRKGRQIVFEAEARVARHALENEVKFEPIYYGRIRVEVPVDTRHPTTHQGRQQLGSVWVKEAGVLPEQDSETLPSSGVTLKEVIPWPHGPLGFIDPDRHNSEPSEGQKAYDELWKRKLEKITRFKSAEDFQTVADDILSGHTRVLYYFINDASLDLCSVAYVLVGTYMLAIEATHTVELDLDKKGIGDGRYDWSRALVNLRKMTQSTVTRLRLTKDVLASGQSLERVLFHGPIALIEQPFDVTEEAGGGFDYAAIFGAEGGLGFHTAFQASTPKRMVGVDVAAANQAQALLFGVKLTTLRSGYHTVDGLEGEEFIASMSDNSGSMVTYEWRQLVQGQDLSQIVIALSVEKANVAKSTALWDHTLDTLRWLGPTKHPK